MMVSQILLDPFMGQQRPHVDHQLEQVRGVLAVQTRVEVLLLLGFPQLLEQVAITVVSRSSRLPSAMGDEMNRTNRMMRTDDLPGRLIQRRFSFQAVHRLARADLTAASD